MGIPQSDSGSKAGYALVLLFVAGLTIAVTVFRDELAQLATYGYLGVLIACFAANSTVFLPAPSSAIVFISASIYSPFWVAVIGGLGSSVGEVMGYWAGYSGRRIIQNTDREIRIQRYVDHYGIWAVLVFAFLPLPLFDLVGVVAGASQMSLVTFLVPCLVGKTAKMFLYAYVGAGLLPLIVPYVERFVGS